MDPLKVSKFFQSEDRNFKANYKRWLEEDKLESNRDPGQQPSVVIDEVGEDLEESVQKEDESIPLISKVKTVEPLLDLQFKQTSTADSQKKNGGDIAIKEETTNSNSEYVDAKKVDNDQVDEDDESF